MVKVKGWEHNTHAIFRFDVPTHTFKYPDMYGTQLVDISTTWHRIHIYNPTIHNWILNQKSGSWRYVCDWWLDDRTMFIEVQTNLYTVFLLRWS